MAVTLSRAPSVDILASSSALLDAHETLLRNLELAQQRHRAILTRFASPPPGLSARSIVPSRSPRARKESLESVEPNDESEEEAPVLRPDLAPIKRLRAARYMNYSPEEETIRNDYSQQYVDGGDWPQNFVQGAEPEHRFEEYPKQQRLLNMKKQTVAHTAHRPCYLLLSELQSLSPSKFDVILVDPPFSSSFTWDTLANLPIPALAADPSFVFLWVGSGAGDGLERGREILYRWGYRRCEDVVWIKTNKTSNLGPGTDPPTSSLFGRTKEHCLIGIRGTVRRSTDSWFVHCNVDTDVMFWEGDPSDPTRKPPETYTLVENFCLGLRRLELFGRSHSLRPGWVTVGDAMEDVDPELGAVKWEHEWWNAHINSIADGAGRHVVPTTPDIEMLRPKSPVPRGSQQPRPMHGGGGAFHQPHGGSGGRGPTFGAMANNNHNMQMQMQMPMPIAVNQGGFPSQHQFTPPHQQPQQQRFPNAPFVSPQQQLHQRQPLLRQPQTLQGQQQLNAFAAPFVPSMNMNMNQNMGMNNMGMGGMGMGMDPNMAAMMGGSPMGMGVDMGMMGPMGVNMGMGGGPMGMGNMGMIPNSLQFDGAGGGGMMQMPGMDPVMMHQMQMQMGMNMPMSAPMGMGMGMGAVPLGMGMRNMQNMPPTSMGPPPPPSMMNNGNHSFHQTVPQSNSRPSSSQPPTTRLGIDILSATPMRQAQQPPKSN